MARYFFTSEENGGILPAFAGVPSDPICFVWQNSDGQADIFITSDPSQNNITITMLNNTGGPLVFTGGDGTYPMEDISNEWTAIYLVFQGLIPNDDIAEMTLTSSSYVQWSQANYTDTTNGTYLAISPASTFTLPSGGTVIFNLNNVAPADAVTQTGPVNFSWNSLSGATTYDENVNVQVAYPPNNNNLDFQPVLGFEGTNIVPIGSTLSNTLTLSITNPLPQALVPKGSSVWGNNQPQFFVNFVFDDTTGDASAGALTTTDLAASLTVTLVTDNGNGWEQPKSNGNLGWVIPINSSPGTVLGIGDLATVELSINTIQVAAAAGTTELLLSWTQIPGVNDGQTAIPILKVEPITITSFSIAYTNSYDTSQTTVDAPETATITNPTGPISCTFSYTVENASFVMITNTPYAKATTGSSFSDTVTINIDSSGTYTLLATNYTTAQQAALSLPVTVTPDVYSLFPLGTVLMWAGTMNGWPSQWVLCDGNQDGQGAQINGLTIPDLRDRFAIGAGGTTTTGIGDSGDPDDHYHQVVISENSLSPSGSDGNHTHSLTFNWTGCMSSGHTSHFYLLNAGNNGSDIGCSTGTHTYTTASSQGDHSHTIPPQNVTYSTTYQAPGASLTNTRPAWYALAYIIKVY